MWVGPFLGDLTIPGHLPLAVPCFLSFVVWSQQLSAPWGPSIWFKYWARTFTCTIGHISAFRTVSKVSLSAILPSDEMFTHAVLMWAHALLRWSKVEMINAHSSSFLIFSGSCFRNSQLVGTSVAGSWTSTPPGVKCCLIWRQAGSFIALTTVSTSTFFICSQWCSMFFFNLWIVDGSASLLSSQSSSPRSSKIWFTFSVYV